MEFQAETIATILKIEDEIEKRETEIREIQMSEYALECYARAMFGRGSAGDVECPYADKYSDTGLLLILSERLERLVELDGVFAKIRYVQRGNPKQAYAALMYQHKHFHVVSAILKGI